MGVLLVENNQSNCIVDGLALIIFLPVQPIHWIYSKEAMEKAVAETQGAPEFLPVSANPYYTLPTGSQSPYGDQLMVMLESLVQCSGELEDVFPTW